MSDDEASYAALGLPPDATLKEVKARYRELNDAYLKILESSRRGDARTAPKRAPAGGGAPQAGQRPKADSGQASPQKTSTEPVAMLKERLASGKKDKAQIQKRAKERNK